MKSVIATIRHRIPVQIIEHGFYAACLGWTATIVAALAPYLAKSLGLPVGHVAYALLAPGTCFNLFPMLIGLRPVLNGAGPVFTYAYVLLSFPLFFIACLTLPAAVFWWILLRDGVTPHEPSPYVSGQREPPFAFLTLTWSIAAAFSAFGLAAIYGLIEARFFHRQGYFHEEAATEMLLYSALPCAFAPVILMVVRRGTLAVRHRWKGWFDLSDIDH